MRHSDEFIRRRLLARSEVDGATGCRLWRRATRGGYGRLWDGERVADAHRLAHEVFIGPVPAGLDVLHECDRPGCIEPEHLWCGTVAENMADRDAKGRRRNGAEKLRGRPMVHLRGALHPRSKLTEDEVRIVKPRLLSGRVKVSALARDLGVSPSLLFGIRSGRNWGWV